MAEPITVTIGDRTFRALRGRGFEHNGWLLRNVFYDLRRAPNESARAFFSRFLDAAFGPKLFFMLAAVLIENGKRAEDWTTEMAQDNADYISTHTRPEDMPTLKAALLVVLAELGKDAAPIPCLNLAEIRKGIALAGLNISERD